MDVLLTVLGVVLAMALITALSLAVAALVGLRSLRKRNRVSPVPRTVQCPQSRPVDQSGQSA